MKRDRDDEFSLDPDQLEPILAERAAASKRTDLGRGKWERLGTFVPREWESRLLHATHTGTYRLALELLYRWWLAERNVFSTKSEPVVVADATTKAARLTRRTRRSALAELEQLKLIKVSRGPGKAPRVTLRCLPKGKL